MQRSATRTLQDCAAAHRTFLTLDHANSIYLASQDAIEIAAKMALSELASDAPILLRNKRQLLLQVALIVLACEVASKNDLKETFLERIKQCRSLEELIQAVNDTEHLV